MNIAGTSKPTTKDLANSLYSASVVSSSWGGLMADCANRMMEAEAELLTARTEVECLAGSLKSVEGRLERVRVLAEKGNCTGIPSGGEHDELVMVYVVKRSDLLAAIKGERVMPTDREMTLEEWCANLVNRELHRLQQQVERVDKLLFGMDEPLQHPVDIDGLNNLFRKLKAAIKERE